MALLKFFLAAAMVVACSANSCEEGWTFAGNSCFKLIAERAIQLAAMKCNVQDSLVAEIYTQEENDQVKAWLATELGDDNNGVGIGGLAKKGKYIWRGSKNVIDFNDLVNPTDTKAKGCLVMDPNSQYSWVVRDCFEPRNFLCKKPSCDFTKCSETSCYSIGCGKYGAAVPEDVRRDNSYGSEESRELAEKKARELLNLGECPQGSLAQIDSKKENDFIKEFLEETGLQAVWTAGYKEGKKWFWQGSEEQVSGFTAWNKPAGSGDCLSLDRRYGYSWRKSHCHIEIPYLCEYPNA